MHLIPFFCPFPPESGSVQLYMFSEWCCRALTCFAVTDLKNTPKKQLFIATEKLEFMRLMLPKS